MAFRYGDNFESMATADLPDRWFVSSVPLTDILVGGGRGGTAALRISSTVHYVQKTLDAQATWIVGLAVKYTGAASSGALILLLDAGTIQCSLLANSDGTLSVVRGAATALTSGTSTLAMSSNNWYFVEWKCTVADSIGANTCKVRVNGVDWINVAAGQDTKSTANATANQVRIGTGTGTTTHIDDVYICDGVGTANNDFLGDSVPMTLRPNGAGATTGWTPSTGSNYQNVDDVTPNDDTDYNSSATPGQVDTFALPNLVTTPAAIHGVNVVVQVRKDDAGNRQVAIVVRSGGVDHVGISQAVLDNYSVLSQIWEVDPATGLPWTKAGIDAMEAGVKLVELMALLFFDSFDTLASADVGDRYALVGSPTVVAGAGRFGTSNLRVINSTTAAIRSFPPRSTLVVGATVRFSSPASTSAPFLTLLDAGTPQCSLLWSDGGTIAVVRGQTQAVTGGPAVMGLLLNTWYFVEWKVTIADSIVANSCKVRVNGVEVINVATGQDLQFSTLTTAGQLKLWGVSGTNIDFDEVYICDDTGTVNNDFLGDGKVSVLRPTGAGAATGWTPSTGANWQHVDDPTPTDDTDYNSTSTVNALDTFAVGDLPFTPASIAGIMTSIQVRKDDVGARQVAIVVRSGGVDHVGTAQAVTDTYTSLTQVWEFDPTTGLPWTKAGIDALEVGYKLIS